MVRWQLLRSLCNRCADNPPGNIRAINKSHLPFITSTTQLSKMSPHHNIWQWPFLPPMTGLGICQNQWFQLLSLSWPAAAQEATCAGIFLPTSTFWHGSWMDLSLVWLDWWCTRKLLHLAGWSTHLACGRTRTFSLFKRRESRRWQKAEKSNKTKHFNLLPAAKLSKGFSVLF